MNSEDALQLSPQEIDEQFDLLAAGAKEYAVFLVGLDGRLLCWNPAAERVFGYQAHEILGQHLSRFSEVAPDFHPDVMLVDIGLPGMDGYQVARRLREKPEFQTVVLCALTGFTPSDADRYHHPEKDFNYHFVKPLAFGKLLELFNTIEKPADAR